MKLKKVLSGVIAATMAVTTIAITPVFSSAELIVVGENVVDSGTELGAKTNLGSVDWGGSIKINAADLSDYPVGTPVKVDIATTGETGGQVYIVDGSDWSASATWYNNPGATVYVELTEAMKENGIMFNGSDADISKVSFLDFTKYTKIKTFSDLGSVSWGGAVKIESSELSDIPVGAILKVGIKTTGDDGGQVYVVDGSNWSASATWYNKPGADVLIEFTSDMQSNGIMCNGSDADIESITAWIDLIAVESVTINETELALKKDETATLTATVEPEGADDGITWTTSNNKVATVAPDGKVTAVASGTATITATSTADETKKAECEVTVTNPATAIAFENTTETVLIGEANAKTLAVTTTPTDADALTYIWNSSKPEVATVANGVVTGVAAGEAVITVTAGTLTASCTVTVTAETKPATKVTLDKTTLTLEEEKTDTLTATITPADSTDSITWTSSAPAVATVDQTGKVTAVAEGTATITAKANDEVSATCAVTVTAKAPEIETKAYTLNITDASGWGEAGVTQAAQTNVKVTTLDGFKVGTTTYGDVKNKTLKLDGLAFGSCSAAGVTAENVDVAIYLQFGSGWTWCAVNGTLEDSSIEFDLSTITGVKDTDVLQEIGFQFNIKGNVGGINDMASTAKVTLNAAEPIFTVVGEEPAEPSSYETGNVETVTDYVPATAGTKLVVMSITEAEAASTESYTITVTDNNGKTTSVTTNDCYKAFKYNTANGAKTETAANGFFIIVKVTGVPEGTTVSVTIEATE